MKIVIKQNVIEACARATHEVYRAYCIALGDTSQTSWEDMPESEKSSAMNYVTESLDGATMEQLHESWLAEKRATGWKFGTVKDLKKKEHPCFVSYTDLPFAQQVKDHFFASTVSEMMRALGGHGGLRASSEILTGNKSPVQ